MVSPRKGASGTLPPCHEENSRSCKKLFYRRRDTSAGPVFLFDKGEDREQGGGVSHDHNAYSILYLTKGLVLEFEIYAKYEINLVFGSYLLFTTLKHEEALDRILGIHTNISSYWNSSISSIVRRYDF